MSSFPKIVKVLKVSSIKLWGFKYENSEFLKFGTRKRRPGKDTKFISESPGILSNLLVGVCENIEKQSILKEFALFGLPLSVKMWARLGSSLVASSISSIILKKCSISATEFEVLFQSIGSTQRLQLLDLSDNKLSDSCGYLLGRIISKQGERRDTVKWEGGLRGSIAGIPDGLTELYISNNQIGDHGWEKITSSLVSDTWLRLLDAKKNGITNHSYIPTREMMEQNHSLLILDLRENSDFSKGFLKVLEMTESNFDYLDRESYEHHKYAQMFEMICNDEKLPEIYEIKVFSQEIKKKSKQITPLNKSNAASMSLDKRQSSVYMDKISQECQVLRVENEKLRKKLGKSSRKHRPRLENTQDYIALAEKKKQEANKLLELVAEF